MGTVTARSERYCKIFEGLRSGRANWDSLWQNVSKVCWPAADRFWQTESQHTTGERKDEVNYDNTAQLSLQYYVATQESMLVPRGQKYHTLTPRDHDLRNNYNIRS